MFYWKKMFLFHLFMFLGAKWSIIIDSGIGVYDLAPCKRQTFTWTNINPAHWLIFASPDLNELITNGKLQVYLSIYLICIMLSLFVDPADDPCNCGPYGVCDPLTLKCYCKSGFFPDYGNLTQACQGKIVRLDYSKQRLTFCFTKPPTMA